MMKLRQCVFVAKDLESSREELCDILGIDAPTAIPESPGLVTAVRPTGHDFSRSHALPAHPPALHRSSQATAAIW